MFWSGAELNTLITMLSSTQNAQVLKIFFIKG